jgi:hypothetical protein
MKIHPVEAKLIHVDRWSDMMKLTFAFRNFANASKLGTAVAVVVVVVVVVVVIIAV